MARELTALAAALTVIAVGATAVGQQPQGTSITRRSGAQLDTPAVAMWATSVTGCAWTTTNDPVPDATVRLRNLLSGRIEASTVTNASGEFVFGDVEGGTYVVELLGKSGRVVALGAPFTVAPGEMVATFVRLGPSAPWLTGVLSNAAAAAVSTAAGIGVTAVTRPTQNASGDR
jgi:hypothetical protein